MCGLSVCAYLLSHLSVLFRWQCLRCESPERRKFGTMYRLPGEWNECHIHLVWSGHLLSCLQLSVRAHSYLIPPPPRHALRI